jgi:chromosomal replication initiator protein
MTTNVWNEILDRAETKINRHSFYTWFKPTAFVREADNEITVRVPNGLFRDWLTTHYAGVISEAVTEIQRDGVQITFVAEGEVPSAEPLPPASIPPPATEAPSATHPPGLNPRYTFDTFVVGSSNQFAHAGSLAVAEAPSRSYNPLFLYGGAGLGKTHLMHAIGHYLLAQTPQTKLTYISSERFMNEMINAVRYDKILTFRERYRTVDILLVDDIQFLAGKVGTQTEFFHTFNSLYDAQKQIVLSSDCLPAEIPSLEERLRSRFQWGLIADIQPPDLETKVAILKKKAGAEGVPLPDDVSLYIAGKIKSNVRELEGSLIRLIAYASLTGSEISLSLAQEVLRDLLDHDNQTVTIETVQRFVSDYYKIKIVDLKSRNNSTSVTLPRQIAMYLIKALTNHSLPQIGKSFGGKHHSTVIHSIKKIEERCKRDSEFRRLINGFLQALN